VNVDFAPPKDYKEVKRPAKKAKNERKVRRFLFVGTKGRFLIFLTQIVAKEDDGKDTGSVWGSSFKVSLPFSFQLWTHRL
jgi:hypothetical protein